MYPFGEGEAYFENELKYLSLHFDYVTLIPRICDGKQRQTPKNVKIDSSYANKLKRFSYNNILFIIKFANLKLLLTEIIQNDIYRIMSIKKIISYLRLSENLLPVLEKNIELYYTKTVLYSYWTDASAFTLARMKINDQRQIITLARAHGFDLYKERHQDRFIPFREYIYNQLNYILPISFIGQEYICKMYQVKNCEKIRTLKLGVDDPGFDAIGNHSYKSFSIVSCSALVPIKRVDLIIDMLKVIGKTYPKINIVWYHIGDGILRKSLEKKTNVLPENIVSVLLGHLAHSDVIEFYKKTKIDLFLNLSQSEGIPVSIMEAQSCSIPVMATDVGGTKEIVNDDNGFLLPSSPTPEDILKCMNDIFFKEGYLKEKKSRSKVTWKNVYHAEKNYKKLLEIMLNEL